jgi:hypothetical protein
LLERNYSFSAHNQETNFVTGRPFDKLRANGFNPLTVSLSPFVVSLSNHQPLTEQAL